MDGKKIMSTWGEWLIWLVGALLLLIPTGLYFYIFIPASNHTLSANHAAWASFGSFFGGTVGPVISGLAFFYVWKAYQTQQKQLLFSESRATIDELQRQLSTTAAVIDFTLTQPVLLKSDTDRNGKTFSLSEILGVANHKKRNPLGDDDLVIVFIGSKEYTRLLTRLESQLYELCWCMGEFRASGGSYKIIDFYGMKYKATINDLSNAYEWTLNDEILRFFPTTD